MPAERYYSPAFAALEVERMWPKVWQLACMVDHVAEPGDYFEYRCGPYGVLIVRGDDGVLRAFQNACRHRGNSVCAGSGSGLHELKCGYHGWTWDLAGALKRVPNRKGFGSLRMSDFPLLPVRLETWEGLVFVNLDPDAMPLTEYLEAVPDDIAWCKLGNFRCYATLTVEVDANWKTIADGYSETYHIQTLHPELLRCVDDIHAPQQIWGHTGKSDQPYGVQSPRFEGALSDEEVWHAYVHTQGALMGAAEGTPFPADERRPSETVQDLIAARTRAFAAERGVALDWADTDRITRLHQYNVFPNMALLANADHLTVMCSRPGPDPDKGELVMFLMTNLPPGAPYNKPADVRVSAGDAEPGLVLTQDIRVLPGLQRGMHQPGFTHLVLSSEERRVINMHRNLERYLDLPPAEQMTGGATSRSAQHNSCREREIGPDGIRLPHVMTPSNPWGDERGQLSRQLQMRYQTLARRRARRMCQSFERVGVRTAPERLREMLAGAPLAAHEVMDINFALIAIRLDHEARVARYKRLKRSGSRSLMFAGLILVVLNFLMCMAYVLLNLAEQSTPL